MKCDQAIAIIVNTKNIMMVVGVICLEINRMVFVGSMCQ